jgi:hypothetical protein
MGMQTMQTQQPMRQSMGKGMGQQAPTTMDMPQLQVPSSLQQGTAQDKAAFYNNALGQGYNDQAIRSAVTGSIGQQTDSDWGALQGLAKQTARPNPTDGFPRQMTYSGQNGQPRFGQPNSYSNTVNPWDNATIAPQYSSGKGGKTGQPATQQPTGKSGGQASNYPTARTNFTYNPVTTPLQNNAATQVTTRQNTQQTTVLGNDIPGMYRY